MRLQPTFRKLNLQFFAEPSEPAPASPAAPAAVPAPAAQPANAASPLTLADVTKVLDVRLARAENSTVHSLAAEYNMTEQEVRALFDKAKAEKAKALPEAAQAQIDAAKAELQKYKLAAEVAKEGAALGLLDADVAMTLLGEDATKTNDKGEFTGLKAALEKLKETKPYLFGATQKPGAMAQRVSGGAPGALSSLEDKFYDRNPELRPK